MDNLATQISQQLVNGITLGCIYGLIALGYSMVYGILEILNFAHGDVFMVGAYVGWGVLSAMLLGTALAAPAAIVFALMLIAAMLVCGLIGIGMEYLAYRPLRTAPRLAPLLAALGVSLILEYAVAVLLGTKPKVILVEPLIPSSWQVEAGGVTISLLRVMIVAVSLVLMFILDRIVVSTRLGRAMRATAQDREAAQYMGINTDRIISFTFFLGAVLAGAGGVLVGLFYTQIDFIMGWTAGLKAFTAAVLGGIGNIRGAMLGGILLGLVESFGVAFISSSYRDVIAFTILILLLVFRPQGLLGEALPEKV
jgi:branched-chain amino acid transport system permease protein